MADQRAELTVVLRSDGQELIGTLRVTRAEAERLRREIEGLGGEFEEVNDKGKRTSSVISGIATAAVGLVSSAAAGFGAVVSHSIQAADACYEMSRRLGTTTEFLSTMHAVGRQNGVAIDEMNRQMETFSNTLTRAAGGSKQQAQLFRDMGVSTRDASGGVRQLSDIIPQLAAKFATYKEGPAKAALANTLFGEGASKLIPTLNQLGSEGFDAVSESAARMGLVLDTETAAAAHQFNDQMQAVKLTVLGYANDVARDVLPNLVQFTGLLSEQATKSRDALDGTTMLGNAIRDGLAFFVNMSAAVQRLGVLLAYFVEKVQLSWQSVKATFGNADFWSAMGSLASGNIAEMGSAIARLRAISQQSATDYAAGNTQLVAALDDSLAQIDATAQRRIGSLNTTVKELGTAATGTAGAVGTLLPPTARFGNAAGEAATKVKRLEQGLREATAAQATWDNLMGRIESRMGPAAKAQAEYERGLRDIEAAAAAMLITGHDWLEILAQWQDAEAGLQLTRDETIASLEKQSDVVGNVLAQLRDDASVAGMTERQRFQAAAVLTARNAWRALSDEQRAAAPLTDQMTASLAAQAGVIYDTTQHIEDMTRRVGEASEQIGDALADLILSGGNNWDDFADSMVDSTKRMVSQMLSEFLRLQLINPILNGMFGTALQTGGGGLMSMFSGGAAPGGAAGTAGAGGGMSATNLLGMGSTIWKGFSGGLSGMSSFFTGTTNVAGAGQFGNVVGGVSSTAPTTSAAAMMGPQIMIAAIVMAVMKNMEYYKQGWRGDFASMDMNFKGFNANALTGGGAWASAGAGELFRGLGMSGSLSNLLSGEALWGKLLGHKKPEATGYATNYLFGGDGVSGTSSVDWKAKGGWFSSDKKGTKTAAMDAEALAAVQAFFEDLASMSGQIAKATLSDAASVITASFKTTYEKDGKTVKEQIGTYMGVQYKEAWEVFQQRMVSWQKIAGADMSSNGEASAFAAQYNTASTSAGQLSGVADMLVAAQADIRNGIGLLGETGPGALTQVANLVKALAKTGESLIDTYSRLSQSTSQLDRAFDIAGITTSKTREEFVRFAAEFAEAAGGIDAAGALLTDYFDRYHTAQERAQYVLDQATQSATSSFAKIGQNLSDFTGEGGAARFREALEAQMDTLSPEQLALWFQAASALGLVGDAMTDVAVASGGTAVSIAQTAEQLAAVNEILAANAWELASEGLTTAQRQIRDTTRAFDEQREQLVANAATVKQLTELEEQREAVLAQQEAARQRQIADLLGGNARDLGAASMTTAEQQIASVNQQYDDQRATLIDLGATVAQLTELEGQRETALAQSAAARQRQIDAILRENGQALASASMTENERAVFAINQQYDDQRTKLIDLGATVQQLTQLESQRGEALQLQADRERERLALARTEYTSFIDGIRRETQQLNTYQTAMANADEWRTQAIEKAESMARAAGMAGASTEDLGIILLRYTQLAQQAQQQLMDSTQAMVRTAYGTSLDREITALQRKLAGRTGTTAFGGHTLIDVGYVADQKRLNELLERQQAQQAVADRLGNAQSIANNLGQLLANNQDLTLDQLAKQLDLPLDLLAQDLGMSSEQLQKYVQNAAEQARGMQTLNASVLDTSSTTQNLQKVANEWLRQLVTGDRINRMEPVSADMKIAPTDPALQTRAAPVVVRAEDTATKPREDALVKIDASLGDLAKAIELLAKLVPLTEHGNSQRDQVIALVGRVPQDNWMFGKRMVTT